MKLYGLSATIALWYILSLILGPQLIPLPHTVGWHFIQLVTEGELLLHSLASLLRILGGILLALITAVPLGILTGTFPPADKALTPVVYLLYPLPKIAFLPVFMLLFGLGDLSKILLLSTVLFFQLLLASRDGVRNLPREYIRVAQNLNLSPKQRFLKLYLPASLPPLFSALRISIGIAMAVLFFAENYATSYGLGYYIMNSWIMINYPLMFCGILAMALTAGLLLYLIDRAEKWACPWQPGE